MGFIEIVFYFAIYAIVVLIGTFVYVKFFEKKVIKTKEEKEKIEQERVLNIINKSNKRDYDKEPIVIENKYDVKLSLAIIIIHIPLFIYLIISNLAPEMDSLDEWIRKSALALGVVGILSTVYLCITLVFKNKHKSYTKFYNNNLEHIVSKYGTGFFNMSSEVDMIRIIFCSKLEVSYGFFPISGEAKKYINLHRAFNDKYEDILFYPLILSIKLVFIIIFYILDLFRVKKYYIFKNDDYIVSVEANEELKDRFGKVPFETLTLTHIV